MVGWTLNSCCSERWSIAEGGVVFPGGVVLRVGLERFLCAAIDGDNCEWLPLDIVVGGVLLRPDIGIVLAFLGGVVLWVELWGEVL